MANIKNRFIKFPLGALIVVFTIVFLYIAYVFISYHRLDDKLALEVGNPKYGCVKTGTAYTVVSWNIGFGAYEKDYSFFMDGGTESWAKSKNALEANLDKIMKELSSQNADFYFIQEVDTDSTRSYHVNQAKYLEKALKGYSFTFAENWDSPFLMYPLTQPHGKSVAGIMTFSGKGITEAVRRSLPIEDGVMKLVDLDRCYSISRVPVKDGGELVLFNLHLSAYTSDGKIAIEQLKMLLGDMQAEYEKGNYCIAGGDFNKDVVGGGSELFGVTGSPYNWAQPIPAETFEGYDISLIGPYDPSNPVPSCRNADAPYWKGQYQVTVDGFMVSANVKVLESRVIDTGFDYSNHNPVCMKFELSKRIS